MSGNDPLELADQQKIQGEYPTQLIKGIVTMQVREFASTSKKKKK
jgi:hypothetical protein